MEVLHELHRAAAAGSPHVAALLRGDLDPTTLVEPATMEQQQALHALLAHPNVDPDPRAQPSGMTPLHVARAFGQRALADMLLARGADAGARDALGRTPDQLTSIPTIAHAIRTCRRVPAIRSAYLASIFAPLTHQFTSPVLGLEVGGALPADAFAAWPEEYPLVVFALGDDAISRLIRLARPIYSAPLAASGLGIAFAIANQLGAPAVARELPSRDHVKQFGVVADPATGAMPVLVRDFGHAFGVCVGNDRSWSLLATADTSGVVADAAAAARAYLGAHPERPTLVEMAAALAAAIAADRDEPWTIQIPGTPEPSEMWLHGPAADAAAVGLHAGAVQLRVRGAPQRHAIATRGDLRAAAGAIVLGVRAQHAAYADHVAASEHVRTLATLLVAELAARLPDRTYDLATRGFATYDSTVDITITGDRSEDVRLSALADGRVHITAHDFTCELAPGDALPHAAIAEAVAHGHQRFAIEQLREGMRFDVLAEVGDLAAGMRVEYLGYDDVDNHFGRYRFRDGDGNERVVAGDCSTPRNGPLGDAHRYLRPIA